MMKSSPLKIDEAYLLDYFSRQDEENVKFWDRLGHRPDLSDKTVLDFGSGLGSICIDVARSGVRKIVGIDIESRNINFSKKNLEENFSEYINKVKFEKVDLLKWETQEKFDVILSKDTFEHTLELNKVLQEMKNRLNDGGKIYIGFGPLYNFYNGDHGRTGAVLPWFHLIFPENFLLRRINKKRINKIRSIEDLGLNKYSFKRYEYILKNSGLKIDYFKVNCTNHPAAILFNILRNIKIFKEYCTFNIYCILTKN